MPVDVRIIVTDAPPLITLAAAKSLDYLLYPGLPVIIPDAVYCEAAGFAGKLGAQEIIDWQRAHEDMVRIEGAHAFVEAVTLATLIGERMPRDLGERAAVELIRPLLLAYEATMRAGRDNLRVAIAPFVDRRDPAGAGDRQTAARPAHIQQRLDQAGEKRRQFQQEAIKQTLVFAARLSAAQRGKFGAIERERRGPHPHPQHR
jgi:hypothetical protein